MMVHSSEKASIMGKPAHFIFSKENNLESEFPAMVAFFRCISALGKII